MGELLSAASLPTWANVLIVIVAIGAVGFGAHYVVEAAARIAKRLGISELVIGLTVVAFGTSAPEFAVTLIASFRGQGDISVGNIVGSNIFNLGFILGGCAMVRAIATNPTLLKRDGAVLGSTTLLLLVLIGWDLRMDRLDGVLLFGLLVIYLIFLFRQRKAGAEEDEGEELPEASRSLVKDSVILVGGLIAIVGGSHFLVESASAIARDFGVSEWVIGVTIVAAGTSAPEFATSLAGVLKGRYAISAGNLIGSDIFNLLGVLGLAGMMRTMEIAPAARMSLFALTGMVFLVLFFMWTGKKVSRVEGLILVLIAMSRWAMDFAARSPG
jgi:cation:H+ antiporter